MTAAKEWKTRCLGELGLCIRGVSYKPEDLRPEPTAETVTLLRSNNIREGRLNFVDVQFVKASSVREDQILQNEDIAICMSNGNKALVGKSDQFIDSHQAGAYTVGAFCAVFRPSGEFDATYVRYLFSSEDYQRQLDGILAGSAINNLKKSDIAGITSTCPSPKVEQAKIAEVLSTVDRAIEKTEALVSKQQHIKIGLMQDLLSRGIDEQGRIRSKKTHKFKNSALGRIPEEWRTASIGGAAPDHEVGRAEEAYCRKPGPGN